MRNLQWVSREEIFERAMCKKIYEGMRKGL